MVKALGTCLRPWGVAKAVGTMPRTWGRGQGLGGVTKDVRANPNPNTKAVEA